MRTNFKIIYGCHPSYVSLCVLNLLIIKYQIKIDSILISTKDIVIKKQKIVGIKRIHFFLKNYGLKFSFYQIIISSLLPMLSYLKGLFIRKNRILSFKQLSNRYNVPLIYSSNFNNVEFVNSISKANPNIFLSMSLNQILKDNFIKIFDIVCLNMHPSKLPDFRGPYPIFQFLLSPEPIMGITLHKIIPEIDRGDIIMTQNIFRKKNDTHLSLLCTSIKLACKLFSQYIENTDVITIPQSKYTIKYPYKSWPTKSEIKQFNSTQKYFSLKDIFLLVLYGI